jgi:acetolactate synthase-1/3 small subunit
MNTTFVVHVENRPGVLNRVASLFRRRAFNIESLTVGRTERPSISRMTIVVDTDSAGAARLQANLYKLVNVITVENITGEAAVHRDLAMVKISTTAESRAEIMQLAHVFRARVVDVGAESIVLEITGAEDKIDGFVEVVRPYGILEMARTGRVAMTRGTARAQYAPVPSCTAASDPIDDEAVSYSV